MPKELVLDDCGVAFALVLAGTCWYLLNTRWGKRDLASLFSKAQEASAFQFVAETWKDVAAPMRAGIFTVAQP